MGFLLSLCVNVCVSAYIVSYASSLALFFFFSPICLFVAILVWIWLGKEELGGGETII